MVLAVVMFKLFRSSAWCFWKEKLGQKNFSWHILFNNWW